ncbi:MAG: LysM peptidoglycan-binding domain-containing protein [Bacilli bacterium]|nr:LysM peptidoglycan-binding domain-containing protein [Bacilli bacterium]
MQTYIVHNGDTLYGISKQFGISVEDIKLANNLTSNNIVVGSSLVIPSAATTTLYIVKPGDSLYSIAKKYNTTVADLMRINNLKSNVLHIGQQLKIPINDIGNGSDYIIYVVKAGDSLYSISKKYGLSVDNLRRYNNLTSDLLSIGQQLKIPNNNMEDDNNEESGNVLIYVVKAGDSLYSIAKKYGVTVDSLIKLNNLTSNNLSIGQYLKIAFKENNIIPIGSSCYGEGYNEPTYVTYVVKRGDSLYNIAKKYNVSVDSIKKLNNLTNNNLSIGQILKIKENI